MKERGWILSGLGLGAAGLALWAYHKNWPSGFAAALAADRASATPWSVGITFNYFGTVSNASLDLGQCIFFGNNVSEAVAVQSGLLTAAQAANIASQLYAGVQDDNRVWDSTYTNFTGEAAPAVINASPTGFGAWISSTWNKIKGPAEQDAGQILTDIGIS